MNSNSKNKHSVSSGHHTESTSPAAVVTDSSAPQNSLYTKKDRPVPDNNPLFQERSNPLSSKGN